MNEISGVIVLNKPSGMTSYDTIRYIKRLLNNNNIKIGFLGTLDPMAEGVLPIFIGKATKIISFVKKDPKVYRLVITFGIETDSYDLDGNIVNIDKYVIKKVDGNRIHKVIKNFIGVINQVPPVISACKVNGKPSYKWFYNGEKVELKPRKRRIFNIEVKRFYIKDDLPKLEMIVSCESGTYMRSLAMDIGKAFKTAGALSYLCRLGSGDFFILNSYKLEDLEKNGINSCLIDIDRLLDMPEIMVSRDSMLYKKIINGNIIDNIWDIKGMVKIKTNNSYLIAIYKSYGNILKAKKILV